LGSQQRGGKGAMLLTDWLSLPASGRSLLSEDVIISASNSIMRFSVEFSAKLEEFLSPL